MRADKGGCSYLDASENQQGSLLNGRKGIVRLRKHVDIDLHARRVDELKLEDFVVVWPGDDGASSGADQ